VRRLHRVLLFTAFVLVLLLGTLGSLSVVTVRESFPTTTGQLAIPGLAKPVDVWRDGYGVPQIYADTSEDLFMAQGYVQAQDRFFEMDFRRHVTSGRLSEWFGPAQYDTDAFIRTLGWRRVAEQEVGLLSSASRRYLDAYTAGVNAYLNEKGGVDESLEFSILGLTGLDYTPDQWTPADSLSWIMAVAWQLGANSEQESELARVTALHGADLAMQLWPVANPKQSRAIVSSGAVRNGAFDPTASGNGRPAPAVAAPRTQKPAPAAAPALERVGAVIHKVNQLLGTQGLNSDIGSNSWVLSGSRTSTGRPILSNDPHLPTSIPSAFTQVGLHCRTLGAACPFNVTGFSFAGMPGVIIGRNDSVAWGFTTSYADVQDLYLEQVRAGTVLVGKRWQPLMVRTEQISVLGEAEPRKLTVRTTRHGPLVSDIDTGFADVGKKTAERGGVGRPADGYAVSLAWTALKPAPTLDALFALDTATDFARFRAAAAKFTAPSQNLVYADTQGNIGYQMNGSLPIRGKGDGLLPNPGWDPAYDWKGTIPAKELPYLYNPPSGMIVTANQTVISASYPYVINNGDQSYGWRSDVIFDRLSALDQVTPAQSTSLFYDSYQGIAAMLVPALLRVQVSDPWVAEGQRTMVGWDYRATADSAPAAYFNVVLRDVWQLTFHDDLPPDLWPTGGDRWQAVIVQMLAQPRNWWWDDHTTPRVETRDDILLAAMTQARKDITASMSRDVSGWQWGKLHRARLVNQSLGTSGIAPVEALFNRGDYPVGGTGAAVDALAWNALDGYQVTAGPTMRMMIDFADPDGSSWVNQSGVSGHAFNSHYDDQLTLWATNQLWPFVSSQQAIEAATVDRLRLMPSN